MIRFKEAKKRPGRLSARLKHHGLRLQSRAGCLVLKAFARQVRPEWNAHSIGVAIFRAHELAKIGREGLGAFQAPVGHPRMRSALGKVLPAHENMIQAWTGRDVMIEILTGVGLVVHQEPLIAEPKILDQNSIARKLLVAIVGDFDPPKPRVQPRVKPQRDSMSDPALLSFPHIAVIQGSDAKRRFWAYNGENCGLRSAYTQIEARHAIANRQGQRLIDDDPAVRFRVLDGEDRAGRQDADGKPRPIGDPQKGEIVSMRRRQDLNRRIEYHPSHCP